MVTQCFLLVTLSEWVERKGREEGKVVMLRLLQSTDVSRSYLYEGNIVT